MSFIDTHWRRGHVLATSREVLDWQYRANDDSYNVMLAWQGNELLGVLGYIPTQRYDPALALSNVLWLALWKVRDDCKVAGLGLALLGALEKHEPHIAIAVNGINAAILPIYRALGYTVGELSQYYAVDREHPRRLIARSDSDLPKLRAGRATCTELNTENILDHSYVDGKTPPKTAGYFRERYLRHPFYKYRVFHLNDLSRHALIATRVARHEEYRALRIVDLMGDFELVADAGSAIETLLRQECAEYVDFWSYGLPDDPMARAGFGRAVVGGEAIVPNYFEPFEARTISIYIAFKSRGRAFTVYRGDGDQDRPNSMSA